LRQLLLLSGNECKSDFSPVTIAAMSIDKSGEWWVGASPDDIKQYLDAYSADAYPANEFRQAKCGCGGETFEPLCG
jgi:hypothetical protein